VGLKVIDNSAVVSNNLRRRTKSELSTNLAPPPMAEGGIGRSEHEVQWSWKIPKMQTPKDAPSKRNTEETRKSGAYEKDVDKRKHFD
jgi:hypothetical protein